MTDMIVCPTKHALYKLPSSVISNRNSGWDFFMKVNAKQWDFESFKVHQNATSKTQKNLNSLNNDYKQHLQEIIKKNMVPVTLLDYIKQLKDKKWVKNKRKLNENKAPLSVTSTGTYVVNNINNGKEQTNNNIHVGKRRKLRPEMSKDTHNNSDDSRSLVCEESDDSRSLTLEEIDDSRSVASLENDDLDDSFDSVDNHPKAVNYYNYLVENGQKEWNVRAEDVPDVIYEDLNITKILQEYRRVSVIASKRLLNISDCRVLSLSFIFPFSNQNLQNSFSQSCKQHHLILKGYVKPFTLEPVPEDIIKWCNRIDASHDLNDDDKLKQTIKSMKEELGANTSEAMDIHLSITQRIVKEIRSWNSKNTEDDFMGYIYFFIDEIFSVTRSPLLNVHKTMKRLSTESCHKPDIKLSYEYKKDQDLDLCVIEVKKKSNTAYTPNNSDFIKIHLEMKSMLSKLIQMNVEDPVVYGLLFQGFDCQVFRMTLNGDGFYFSPVVRFFHLPRDVSDIMIAPKVTTFFISLKNELDQLVTRIQNKKKGRSPLLPWTRPSYKMPVLIKDPLQHIIDNE